MNLLADPVRRAALGVAAQALVDANRGARDRSLDVIAELLPPGAAPRPTSARAVRAVLS